MLFISQKIKKPFVIKDFCLPLLGVAGPPQAVAHENQQRQQGGHGHKGRQGQPWGL
jgi:hypothetical protein